MDQDLKAMAQIRDALAELDPKAVARVLGWAANWAADAYGISIRADAAPKGTRDRDQEEDEPAAPAPDLDTLAGFYEAATPSLETEKVLVVGYWLQEVKGQATLDAQQVNAELKNLGHASKNITRAFSGLMSHRPQLAVQVRKTGSTQQARKRYKLTNVGVRRVEEMIGGRRVAEERTRE